MKRNVRRVRRFVPERQAEHSTPSAPPRKRGGQFTHYLGRYLPAVIIVGIITYVLLFSGLFQIREVSVDGPSSNLSDQLQTAAKSYLKSGWLTENWLFLDTKWLADQLKKQFSQSDRIVVEKQFPNKIVIKSDEQNPAMVWQSGGRYYLVSAGGRVITEQGSKDNADLLHVTDNNNIPVQAGDHVVSKNFVDFATHVQKYAADHSLNPLSFSVTETTTELLAKTPQGYIIKFDTSQDVNSQLRSLTAVLDSLNASKKKPAKYIDLRVRGKVFYK